MSTSKRKAQEPTIFPVLKLAGLLETIDNLTAEWKDSTFKTSLTDLRIPLSDQMTALQRAVKSGDLERSWDAFKVFAETCESIIQLIRKEQKSKMPKYMQYQLQDLPALVEQVVGLANPELYIAKKQKVDPYTNPYALLLLHAADSSKSEGQVVKELIRLQLTVSQTFKQIKIANQEKDYNQLKLLNSTFIVYLDKVQSLLDEFEGVYPEIRKIIVNFSHHKQRVAQYTAPKT
jgi:hypothetical protein